MAEYWAALHFLALCKIPVRQRLLLADVKTEFKAPAGTNESVLKMIATMEMPPDGQWASLTTDDCKRRDDFIIQVFVTEFGEGGDNSMAIWRLFWVALRMLCRNRIPLRLKSEPVPDRWRLGTCFVADFDTSHRRGVPPETNPAIVNLANTLDIDDSSFPLGPDAGRPFTRDHPFNKGGDWVVSYESKGNGEYVAITRTAQESIASIQGNFRNMNNSC